MPWREWRDRRAFADWRLGIKSADDLDDDDEEVDFG